MQAEARQHGPALKNAGNTAILALPTMAQTRSVPPIYLDWAATAPPDAEILEEVSEIALRFYGNPSSLHRAGREAEKLLGEARARLAAVLGVQDREVVFTSGGTEANNLVLFSLLRGGPSRGKGRRVVAGAIEHASVHEPLKALEAFGCPVVRLPAAADTGRVDPRAVERELGAAEGPPALVALMRVNNETGAIQPLEETAAAVRGCERQTGRKIHLHTDAVQALGKVPFRPAELGVDSAAFSAHKIGGPRGIGALYLSRESRLQPLYTGGGQEGGIRPGTENLPAIWGFVLAAEKRLRQQEEETRRARRIMDYLVTEIGRMEPAVLIPRRRAEEPLVCSPFILCVSFPPIPGEVMVRVLEERGVLVSTGSACSSRKKDRFRVAEAMGLPRPVALSTVRVSLGHATRPEEAERLVEALREELPALLRVARRG